MTGDPYELVRVRDQLTGHHYTTRRLVADAQPDRYVILDRPAATPDGTPLPPKPRRPITQ